MNSAADGGGSVEAAENVRLRFQRLQLQWERAGAAAATVTGLDYVAYMQFNAFQFVQEVLRTRTYRPPFFAATAPSMSRAFWFGVENWVRLLRGNGPNCTCWRVVRLA